MSANIRIINETGEQPNGATSATRPDQSGIYVQESFLNGFLSTIMDSKGLITVIVLLSLLLGFAYILKTPPVYRADVLLQVEEKPEHIGAKAELAERFKEVAAVSEVFEILRSRMILGRVIDSLKLDIVVHPRYFPFIGDVIARYISPRKQVADPWFGLKQYAWGGERIQIERFDVPALYQDKPMVLVAGEGNSYELFEAEGKLLASGVVGEVIEISLTDEEAIHLLVSELQARPKTQFELIKMNKLTTFDELRESLNISEQGKQSGILKMRLDGREREIIATILNEITDFYLQKSVERKSAEAAKALSLIEEQLPVIKGKMESAETALNNYRLETGSIDLPLETRSTLEKTVTVEAQLNQLKRDRAELTRLFTSEHPRVLALDAQIATLVYEISRINLKLKALPAAQQKVAELTREMDLNATLYTELLNSAQELKLVKAGALANVRVVDYALVPTKSIKPNKAMVIVMAAMLGMLLGITASFIRKNLRGAIHDPELVEKKFGIPVYSVVPYSRKQRQLDKNESSRTGVHSILAVTDASDLAVESLRSLRTSLYFAQMNAKNNVILITAPGPEAGKSFVTANLGVVLAHAGKKTLIVDADLRKGRINDIFGIEREPGLTNTIAENLSNSVIYKTEIENLDIIPTGFIPLYPSELLLHRRFMMAFETIFGLYDYVIIDSPPVLAATDAAIISHLAGATIMVVRDGQHSLREIEQSVKRLQQASGNLSGIVYNGLSPSSSRYGYGRYYGLAYSYSYSNKK